jgi:hypothetical protein
VRKRAEYEAFEFALAPGGVRVTNASHADPSEHEYLVRVDDGLPESCTCPADARFEGACKHRVAVAIRRSILEPAIEQSVATDGGIAPSEPLDIESDDEREDSECDCNGLPEGVPCWACYRDGKQTFETTDEPPTRES